MLTESYEPLADSPIYNLLTPRERMRISKATILQRYANKAVLYKEKDDVRYFYFLVSGSVALSRNSLAGHSGMQLVGEHEFFDVSAFFTDGKHSLRAEACRDSVVAKIPILTIEFVLSQNTQACHFFLYQMGRELSGLWSRYMVLRSKSMPQRLADTLLYIVSLYGYEEDGSTLPLQLSRKTLADLCAMTSSNVSRMLTSFVAERVLALEGRSIKVLDELALREVRG